MQALSIILNKQYSVKKGRHVKKYTDSEKTDKGILLIGVQPRLHRTHIIILSHRYVGLFS